MGQARAASGGAAGHHRRQDARPNSPDARAGASGTGVRRGLNALSKIDLFGSRRRGAKAAQAQFKASQAALDCARLGLSAEEPVGPDRRRGTGAWQAGQLGQSVFAGRAHPAWDAPDFGRRRAAIEQAATGGDEAQVRLIMLPC